MPEIANKKFIFLFYITFFYIMNAYTAEKPNDFIYLKSLIPTIYQEMRYYSTNNFIGRPIPGYEVPVCILTKQAASALLRVQTTLKQKNLGLKVFDCYRPQMAVDYFYQWSQNTQDQTMKKEYYPRIDKAALFELNYIARRSGHTRGSTVDLTIVDLASNNELDMGTPFDFMDPLSHPDNQTLTQKQLENRQLLSTVMKKFGFNPLKTEWWHFTLQNEPYKNTYFNFPIR